MEKNMENEMETGIISGFIGWILRILHDPRDLIARELWYNSILR